MLEDDVLTRTEQIASRLNRAAFLLVQERIAMVLSVSKITVGAALCDRPLDAKCALVLTGGHGGPPLQLILKGVMQ